MDVYKYIMEKPNIVKRLNTIIQDSEKPRINLVGKTSTSKIELHFSPCLFCAYVKIFILYLSFDSRFF